MQSDQRLGTPPKVTLEHRSKLAGEGHKLLRIEQSLQTTVAALSFAALVAAVYLVLPLIEARGGLTLGHWAILSFVVIFLMINVCQSIIMIRLKKKWAQLEKESTFDALTLAFNRRSFEDILGEELGRAKRYKFPVSVCLLDLDDFKTFNDTFGHPRGDALLVGFAERVLNRIRTSDCFARYGGDEFCILLPHTSLANAEKFINRMLSDVQEWLDCTFSAGITVYRPGEDKVSLLGRADLALYQAKREGKNRIRCIIGEDDNQTVVKF